MLPKKKPSGLAKKVPAIFEGLPDIEELKNERSAGIQTPGHSGSLEQGKILLLFEFTSSLLKALLVRYDGKNMSVLKLKSYPLDSLPDTKKMNLPSLEKSLDECLKEFRVPEKTEVRIIVHGDSVFLGKTEKPAGPKKQIRDAVIWQLSEKASFPFENSDIRYHERGGMLTVAAIETEWRESFLNLFHSRNIYPELIALMPLAFEALQQKKGVLGIKNILLLDMGEDQSSLMIFQKGQFVMEREGPYGVEQVLRSMKGTLVVEEQTLTIQYTDAKALLSEFGLPTANLAPDPLEPKLSQLSARVRPIFEKLIQEIRSTILQYQKQSPSEKIEEICLTGTGESIKGFDQYLANQLNFPIRRLDVKRFGGALDGGWTGVLGLTFLNGSPFNLTSIEDALLPRFRYAAEILKRATLAGVVVFAVLAVIAGVSLNAKKQGLSRKEKNFQELNQENKTMLQIQNLKTSNEQRKNLLRLGTPASFFHGAVLRELSRVMPDGVILTSAAFKMSPVPSLKLSGKVIPSAGNPDTIISEFLVKLNRSPFFDHSGLDSRNGEENQKDIFFVIQMDLVKPEDLL